jgi:hypothetical protein
MDNLEKLFNKLFYDFLYPKNSNTDILLKDLEKMKKYDFYKNTKVNDKLVTKLVNKLANKSMNIKNKIETCKFKSKINLSRNNIFDTLNIIRNETDQNKVESILNKIIYQNLPSTIPNLNNYLNFIKDNSNDKVNILIIGAGPNGLFLANYLWLMYKNYYNKVNILVIDNRIDREGYREPYTRSRAFAIGNPSYLTYILPKLACYSDSTLIQIKYLEILLYLKLYENNIPIYFTSKYNSYENIEKLIKDYNFKICFDSSGGRINTPFKVNDFKIPKNFNFISNNKNYSLIRENNLVKLNWKDSDYKHRYYLFIYFLDKNNENIKFEYDSYIITNKYDYNLLKNICIKKDNINSIINNALDSNLKKFLKEISNIFLKDRKIEYLSFNTMEVQLYHQLKIAFLINNNKSIWISSGDTLFHSHFLLGSGLYRTIPLNVKMINLLEIIM